MGRGGDYIGLIREAQAGRRQSVEALAELSWLRVYAYIYRLTGDRHLSEDLTQETLLNVVGTVGNLRRADRFWAWLLRTAWGKTQNHFNNTQRKQTVWLSDDVVGNLKSGEDADGLGYMLDQEQAEMLAGAMSKLSLGHRNVLVLRFYEQMPYHEIASIMNCGVEHVRQCVFRAKQSLKRKLSQNATSRRILASAADVRSFRYLEQRQDFRCVKPGRHSVGTDEQRFYFVEGLGGPALLQRERWDPTKQKRLRCWLQDGRDNYFHDAERNTVTVVNWNLFYFQDWKTWSFPTDSKEFRSFVEQIEGDAEGLSLTRDPDTNLVVNLLDKRFDNVGDYHSSVEYNVLGKSDFGPIWSDDAKVSDTRDAMHKRGWTYFRIKGQVAGEEVLGWGQMPFRYYVSKERRPWLKVNVGRRLKVVDSFCGAYLADAEGEVIANYPAGSFFKGLPRPWTGMHTLDVVRRDAAEERLWFERTKLDEMDQGKFGRFLVTVVSELDGANTMVSYVISIDRDVVDRVEFATGGDIAEGAGELEFEWIGEVEHLAEEFVEPVVERGGRRSRCETMGTLWLMALAEGTLGQL